MPSRDSEYGWYSRGIVAKVVNSGYELTIIDGPPGAGNRFGILLNLNVLENIPILIVDDTDRPSERLLAKLIAEQQHREIENFSHFTVLRFAK